MKKFVFKNLTYIHKSYIAELLLLCMLLYTHVFRKKHFFQFVFCIIWLLITYAYLYYDSYI